MNYATDFASPIGKLLIISDGESINNVCFYNQKQYLSLINRELIKDDDLDIFGDVKKWFDDYFKGLNPEINFKLKPEGSEFQCKVWKILSDIPYGKTTTYGEIASRISPTMSAQAVGGAVGRNPIAVIIPCHRVIGTRGSLTGYAAGLDKKTALLKLEIGDVNE